MRKNNIFYW